MRYKVIALCALYDIVKQNRPTMDSVRHYKHDGRPLTPLQYRHFVKAYDQYLQQIAGKLSDMGVDVS